MVGSRADLTGRGLDAANNAKMIAAVRAAGGFPSPASFVCAAAFVDDTREIVRVGDHRRVMVQAPRGLGGFGYDPHFVSSELGVTFGEATVEQKREVSHRGRAFRAVAGGAGLSAARSAAAVASDRAKPDKFIARGVA